MSLYSETSHYEIEKIKRRAIFSVNIIAERLNSLQGTILSHLKDLRKKAMEGL